MSGFTAHVGYGAGSDRFGRTREVYHAVLTGGPARVLRIGVVTRRRGEALCGAEPVEDCPPGLFEPVVTCPGCLTVAARNGVAVAGTRGHTDPEGGHSGELG